MLITAAANGVMARIAGADADEVTVIVGALRIIGIVVAIA
jgi:hypothetical protein